MSRRIGIFEYKSREFNGGQGENLNLTIVGLGFEQIEEVNNKDPPLPRATD